VVYESWILSKRNLKPKTVIGYQSLWKTVVGPRWGNVRLTHVLLSDVKFWTANCETSTGKKIGSSRIVQGYTVLTNVLDHAVDQGLLIDNPARGNPGSRKNFLPKKTSSDSRNILNREELKLLANNCGGAKDLVLLLGTVGLRFNEAAALKGADLDFDRGIIRIARTFSDINGHIIEQSPKNGKVREVPIPDSLRQNLLSRKIASGSEGYLWTSANGAPLRYSNFRTRVWKPALIASGIEKPFTIHDLRHTSASWLVQHGCKIALLAKMLGHSDASFTLRCYTHLFDDDMEALSLLINRADSA